jgi:hypothetical protein
MLQIIQDPETSAVLQSLILLNLEGEGLTDVREYFRKKLVRSGVLKPTEEDKEELAALAGQEDPQSMALKAMADEATANASKARAGVIKTISETDLNKAKTVQIMTDLENANRPALPGEGGMTNGA